MIDAIGLEPFLHLVQTHGGTYFYIPKSDVVLRRIRDEKIKAEFDGSNYKSLAVKFNLTEISIRRIVESNKNRPLDGQMSLLDVLDGNSVLIKQET
ncbi:MAG: Mor transcription activator family protein [Clostridia bacterium]